MNPIRQPEPTYPSTALAHLTPFELRTFRRLEFLRGIHARTPTNDTLTRGFPRQNLVLTRDPADDRLYWAPSLRFNSVEDFAGQHEFITSAYEEENEEQAERLVFFFIPPNIIFEPVDFGASAIGAAGFMLRLSLIGSSPSLLSSVTSSC